MPDSFRKRILIALTEQIKTVSPQNGYILDLSDFTDQNGVEKKRVFRGRVQFGASDPLPMVSILEDPRNIDDQNQAAHSGKSASSFKVIIQGFVLDNPDDPLDPAYDLSAEVITALVAAKKTRDILGFGGRITAMTIGQPVHRPSDDEISSQAFFLLSVKFTIVEDLEKPYD